MNISMSSKNTKAKTAEKSQSVKQVTQPKVEPVVETKPVQKGGKKSTKQAEPVQVAEPKTEPVVETKPVQKGGKKSTKQAEPVQVAEPKVEPVVETKQSQKGGKKSTKQAEPVQVAEPKVEPVVESKQSQKGGKKSTKQAEPVQVAEPKVEVEAEEEGEEQVGGKLRYFKLFYNDEFQGRYCGRKPKQAANKAFSSIVKDMKKNGNQKGGVNVDVNFSIRECTRNSKHKEYNYVGVRQELKEPVEVKINNEDGSVKKITYSFHNKISKTPKVQS